ncbi:MAG: PEP-CTERM sorting domain-containing protein [Pyrinomonadaceae bacterium]
MKKIFSTIALGFGALVFLSFSGTSARADAIVFSGSAPIQPAGFGTQPYILGIQHHGGATTESGGVMYTASGDKTFGDALTGAQTQTRTLGSLGITQASDLRLYFNINEPNAAGKTTVTIQSLTLTAYDSNGTAVFSASLAGTPTTLTEIGAGQGTSDYVFQLDQAAIDRFASVFSADLRIGLAATITNAQGGPESFFLRAAAASPSPQPGPVPEPATMILLGTGLAGVAAKMRKRRQATPHV